MPHPYVCAKLARQHKNIQRTIQNKRAAIDLKDAKPGLLVRANAKLAHPVDRAATVQLARLALVHRLIFHPV
jgi:hypothetical protein